jgi:hypothetical protein
MFAGPAVRDLNGRSLHLA